MLFSSKHALVVAYLALSLALGGTAYALTIDGGDVVNGSLSGRDIRGDSIPQNDLAFAALARGDVKISNASTQIPASITSFDGSTPVATVTSNAGKGFDALFGTGTISISNPGSTNVRVVIRPYVDGKPHGDHLFTDVIGPGDTDIDTVSITCNALEGRHEVSLVLQVVEGEGVTVDGVEWNVWPVVTK